MDGVTQARQGVARRLAPGALHVVHTAHRLHRELQIPVGAALRISHDLWRAPQHTDAADTAVAALSPDLDLRLGRAAVRAAVATAVAEALEMAPRTKRGRPPNERRTV